LAIGLTAFFGRLLQIAVNECTNDFNIQY
jgi:hypothetical protein